MLRAVLLPFLWTRLALGLVAWLGSQMSSSWSYPQPSWVRRGYAFLPGNPLDTLGRWDAGWYLDVARSGYRALGPLPSVQSNLAFFPLYPWSIAAVNALLPASWRGPGEPFVAAIVVSNVAALAGLALLWRLARAVTGDEEVASRTVLYALVFPFGFILSAAYPESLFLLLAVGALLAALRGYWAVAALLGLLVGMTRPVGVFVAVPLAWIALFPSPLPGSPAPPAPASPRQRWGRAAAVALAPALGLLVHAVVIWRASGDPLALFHAQAAWGRSTVLPWRTLRRPAQFHQWMGPLEAASLGWMAGTGAWLLRHPATRALGLFTLATLVPVLTSGTLMSTTRFAAATFPAFIGLAILGRQAWLDRAVVIVFLSVQSALFLLWSRFFWVG